MIENPRKPRFKSIRFWRKMAIGVVLIPVVVFSAAIAVLYYFQDGVVKELVEELNVDFTGSLEIADSHIAPFETFPYISIDLEHVKVFEDKNKNTIPLVDVEEVFVGFDLLEVLTGKLEIKDIKLKEGSVNLVQHEDGEFNIVKALTAKKEIEDPSEEFHLDLHEIELENIDLTKLNESNNLLVDAYINDADAKFRTAPDHVFVSLDSRFEINIVKDGDTTVIKHKHFDLDTEIDYLKAEDKMVIQPTVALLEGSQFDMEGSIDFRKDVFLDVEFSGRKKDFELFIAMAPEELVPVLKTYENQGDIFFDATIIGPTQNGGKPAINAMFECKNAVINNPESNKKVEDLNFVGQFTNGENRDPSTMLFSLKDFTAHPGLGNITIDLEVANFNDPDIELKMDTRFELDFLADFLNVKDLKDMHGDVDLTMNFHDIINLQHPEHSIEKLNESYFTELRVKDLGFKKGSSDYDVKDVDIYARMNGHEAIIEYCNLIVGKSDLQISGTISDLPAIIHHTDKLVDSRLKINSKFIDIYELTGGDSAAFDEQIENLSLDLDFKSSAKAITESPNLPVGEFFVENLYAKLKHYPHAFHDFHADVIIQEEDMRLIDFTGMIDNSDFHFSGGLRHYDMWFLEHPEGDTEIEFNLASDALKLEDLFSYKGENHVPEDYRHEEFDKLKIHGYADLHFKDGLRSADIALDQFDAKMKVHPLRLENFNGRIHYEDEHLVVENFSGRMGTSDINTTLHWYLGEDESVKKRDNHLTLKSERLNFDELHVYEEPKAGEMVDHDAGFNLYELPFTDMTYDIDIKHMNYHRYLLDNINTSFRTTPDHYIHFDDFHVEAAGGVIELKGYFNGSNPKMIYFSPDMTVEHVDLDKLLFKFENFGQDHLVSENLHGEFSGRITGKIHMHNDLVPKIDDSEIHMDLHVLDGRLEHFALLDVVSDYFRDKNLQSVRFDTLDNHIDLNNGMLTIPAMTINSSLGYMQFEGEQDTDLNFNYYVKVPWKLISQTVSSKLFGKRREEVDPEQVDAIQYADKDKKMKAVNLKVTGNPDDYKISLGKKKPVQ